MDISQYTESEQPRLAGKHVTRLAENGMAVVTCILHSNPASRTSNFLVESALKLNTEIQNTISPYHTYAQSDTNSHSTQKYTTQVFYVILTLKAALQI